MRPMANRVFVRPLKYEPPGDVVMFLDRPHRMVNGIMMPLSAHEQHNPIVGEVVFVGPGRRFDNGTLETMTVKVGDRVTFGEWSGSRLHINGELYCNLHEHCDIYGILDEGEEVTHGR